MKKRENVRKAVNNYYSKRIHNELNNRTPTQMEDQCLKQTIDFLPELTIFNNEP